MIRAAEALQLQPTGEVYVRYPQSDLDFETKPELFRGPNSYMSGCVKEAGRQDAIPGVWPKWTIFDAAGSLGDSPRVFKWFAAEDFPRACKAAYQVSSGQE